MKKFLSTLLGVCMLLSFASCGNKKPASEASSASDSVASSSEVSEPASDSPSKIQDFPEEKMSHSVMDDGNFYLKVQTISGDNVYIREFAAKGKDVYANIIEEGRFEWYYSNENATFVFDDDAKTYEIYSLSSLSVQLFSDEKTDEGECNFFEVECSYVKYKMDDKTSILHFYRLSDGSWLGFQYMYGDEYEDANLILDASDDYPSHVVLSIPEDYEYYFEKGDNEASIDWS